MKSWFKGKQRQSNRGIPDNFDTSLPAEKLQHQTNATNSNAPTPLSTIPGSSTNMYDSDQPSIAYPAYHLNQGSFKLNTGSNINMKGTQTIGGIKLVTSGKSEVLLHYKEVELNTGNNSNEGENQVNSGIELYEVDGSESSERP